MFIEKNYFFILFVPLVHPRVWPTFKRDLMALNSIGITERYLIMKHEDFHALFFFSNPKSSRRVIIFSDESAVF